VRNSARWQKIRAAVKFCDGYQCVSCGAIETLEVHHRNGDVLNNHGSNLVTLCASCHRRADARRLKTRGG
jgi:5-methylcytosine-specific restriction endonuclease McrA